MKPPVQQEEVDPNKLLICTAHFPIYSLLHPLQERWLAHTHTHTRTRFLIELVTLTFSSVSIQPLAGWRSGPAARAARLALAGAPTGTLVPQHFGETDATDREGIRSSTTQPLKILSRLISISGNGDEDGSGEASSRSVRTDSGASNSPKLSDAEIRNVQDKSDKTD